MMEDSFIQVTCWEAGVWLPARKNFCHSFLFSAVLLSATYFPFMRLLGRWILFLPRVAFPLVLPLIISCSNDSCLSTCPNHTCVFSHCVWHSFSWRISGKIIRTILCCVWQLCTMICTRTWTVLRDECWFRFRFSFCAFKFSILCVFWFSLYYFVMVLFAFVALGLVSWVLRQEIG